MPVENKGVPDEINSFEGAAFTKKRLLEAWDKVSTTQGCHLEITLKIRRDAKGSNTLGMSPIIIYPSNLIKFGEHGLDCTPMHEGKNRFIPYADIEYSDVIRNGVI